MRVFISLRLCSDARGLLVSFVGCRPLRVGFGFLCHFDDEQAFVQSNLEDVFMRIPPSYGQIPGRW